MADSRLEAVLRRDRALLIGGVGLLFLTAGLYTVFGVGMDMSALDMTRMTGMRDMPGARAAGDWSAGYALLVVLMWWVMMVAMMLPGVTATLLLHAALVRRGAQAARAPLLTAAFLAGYLTGWLGFSVAAAAAQWGAEAAGFVSPTMMTLTGTRAGAAVLIVAGLYQFTPVKDACLTACQSPAEFLVRRRRPGLRGALTMGLEHGTVCLGCCWVLMTLLFVGGIMNLYWIVGLAAFATLEKLTRIGPALSRLAGLGLLGWGGLILAHSL